MKSKIFNICDIERYTATLEIDVDGQTIELLDALAFKREIATRYGSWSFIGYDTDTVITAFNMLWSHFCELNKFNFTMLYKAMQTKYDPLANYDKYSTFTYGAQTTDNIFDDRKTTTQHGTINFTSDKNGNIQTITNEEKTIESGSDYIGKDKQIINNPQRTNETTQGNDVITSDGYTDTTTTASYINEEYTRGNVGTTRTQDMLEDEKRARLDNLASYIIDMFAKKYLFLLERV